MGILKRKISNGLNYAIWVIATIILYGMALERDVIDNFLVAFAVISALQFVAILIHELGHAWAAHWAGARVEHIAVVPFRFDVRQRRLRFDRYLPAKDIGGFVSYNYGRARPTARNEITIAAAGPMANIVSAALLFAAISSPGLISEANEAAPTTEVVSIVSRDNNRSVAQDSAPAIYPSQETVDRAFAQAKELRDQQYYRDWWAVLGELFIAISLILGPLNLIPTNGSDGARILSNWRRLKSS